MAHRFREARERAGLSTYEVAKRIGVSQPAVNQWDNGNKLPSVEMLCKLADLYCVSTIIFLVERIQMITFQRIMKSLQLNR